MDSPPKPNVTLGYAFGASAYFGAGVLGSLLGVAPSLVPWLSVGSSLLVGAGTPMCISGIARLRTLRDAAREVGTAPAAAQPAGG